MLNQEQNFGDFKKEKTSADEVKSISLIESQKPEQRDISQFPIEKVMRELLEENKHLDQDAVYSALFEKLSDDEIINKIEEDYVIEKNAEEMISLVESRLGKEYVRLLIEPSIGSRLDQFIDFSSQLESKGNLPAPLDLRSQFKNSLGKTKVFRVVAATEKDVASISQQGFISNFYRGKTKEGLLNNQDFYESMEYNMTGLISRINVHSKFGSTKDSTLISVSEYPKMAEYGAFIQLKDKWDEMEKQGYKLYSFPIETDEFDCIRHGKYIPFPINAHGKWTDGQMEIDYNNPGEELFVEFQIPKDNIDFEEIQEIDVNKISQFKFVSDDDKNLKN